MAKSLALITDRRGPERKRQLLQEFDLVPVLHTCLLAQKVLTCCCGDPLRTNFYQFDVREKGTGRSVYRAYAGSKGGTSCAAVLFHLSTETPSPISPMRFFNPLIGGEREARENDAGDGGKGNPRIAWNAFNRELRDAISLISLAWDVAPGSVLSALRDEIEAAPDKAQKNNAKSLNTILRGFVGGNATLTQRLAALRVDNPRLRHYAFPELRRALEERQNERGDVPVVYL